jgi:hypothetical protein
VPNYITNPQPTQLVALYPGNHIALVNNAAIDSGITQTQQFAVGPTPGDGTVTLMITNTTNQQAQGQFAPQDPPAAGGSATYENLSGCIVPAGSTLAYNLQGGWMCFTFGTAPTSGSLIVSR